jgi:hypothetical protein
MLHFAVSLGGAVSELAGGHVLAALKKVADRRNVTSVAAVVSNLPVFSRLA